jgi:hypothetical protein
MMELNLLMPSTDNLLIGTEDSLLIGTEDSLLIGTDSTCILNLLSFSELSESNTATKPAMEN